MPVYQYTNEVRYLHPLVIQSLVDNGFTDIRHEVKLPVGGRIDITAVSPDGRDYIIECKWEYEPRHIAQLLSYRFYKENAVLVLAISNRKIKDIDAIRIHANQHGILVWVFETDNTLYAENHSSAQTSLRGDFDHVLSFPSLQELFMNCIEGEAYKSLVTMTKNLTGKQSPDYYDLFQTIAHYLNQTLSRDVFDDICQVIASNESANKILYPVVFDMTPDELRKHVGARSVFSLLDYVSLEALQLYNVCQVKCTSFMNALPRQLPLDELIERLNSLCAKDKAKTRATAKAQGVDWITGKPLLESGL